ncbi:MAG: bifunctional DNA-formamidopyrimidine glycosylase/DNA-(apurinic or apyrimidinic site) lyase [Magnetococcus sp. YQC-5]
MPELPEVETICLGLKPCIIGQTIQHTQFLRQNLRWPIPVEHLTQETLGQTIRNVERRGKYLVLACGTGHILIHLGMSGRLLWHQTPILPKQHDHVIWTFGNGGQLRLYDPRRFGALLWIFGHWSSHPLLAGLGLEPLDPTFNATYLHQQTQNRRMAVKNWLMNGKVVVGLGNIYASEALFLAGVHPGQSVRDLSYQCCIRLVESIQHILETAIQYGGTTLRDFRHSTGQSGSFINHLQVYGRTGQPCHICTTPIQLLALGQRSSFFCPHCQPLSASTSSV